jgi:hypothetical protein
MSIGITVDISCCVFKNAAQPGELNIKFKCLFQPVNGLDRILTCIMIAQEINGREPIMNYGKVYRKT